MLALRQALRFALLACAAAAAISPAMTKPVLAQGKLEARYTASLAGIPVGKGSWLVDINDTHYSAAATGTTAGLLHIFTDGHGTSTTRGTLQGGRPASAIYASTIIAGKKTDEVRITIANGSVKDFSVEPPQDNAPERVPLTEAHRRDVLDPMTASLLRVPGNGDPVKAEACNQTLAVFDGRLRYDLQLEFKRIDKVKSDKGYAGPVVVCTVYFTPVAGYIASRTAIKYIAKLRDIEIWMAPITGTRVLAPYRIQGPTPIGQAVLEATDFVSIAAPARASANGPKTQ